MILFIYLKVIVVLAILFFCGITAIKRLLPERKLQLVIPLGALFGLASYLFLVNLLAYLIKGPPLFSIALGIELLFTLIFRFVVKSQPLQLPQGSEHRLWIVNVFLWFIFALYITNTSPFDGSDNTFYYSQASVFSRGDFPIHTPWQPDYISYSHLGISQLLGAFRSLTGASYHFIHALFAFITLFCSIQILTWILAPKRIEKFFDLLLFSLPGLIGFISLGAFMLVWPSKLAAPPLGNEVIEWLNKLPTIEISHASAGFLDPLIYILHRLVSTSFLLGVLVILISPLKRKVLTILPVIIFLSAIALLDESILIAGLPAVFLISLFSFGKKIKVWIFFILISLFIIASQGGIVTESIINRYHSGAGILLFAEDNPDNPYENFRTWRLQSQSSTLFPDLPKFQPFRWFQIGIIYQLIFFLIWTILILKKKTDGEDVKTLKLLSAFFLISAVTALIAFHALVPKLFHTNGWRFLAISYQFSGIGIGLLLVYWWINHKKKVLKFLIIWVLFFSIIPPFARLLPRRDDLSWFKIHPEVKRVSFEWIKNNLPVEKRILALTDSGIVPSSNMDLATQIGVFTPIWAPEIRAYENYDTSPAYADLYYTLNPKLLRKLKVDYLIINNTYVSRLPEQRKKELLNYSYFQPVYSDPSEIIIKVMPAYLQANDIVTGTLEELDKIAPLNSTFYLDHKSLDFYRAVAMVLRERRIYGEHDYWSRIEGKIPIFGKLDHYDYLVLGKDIIPQGICDCNATKVWSGLLDSVNLWKIIK